MSRYGIGELRGGQAPRNGPPGGGFFSSLHEGRHGLIHLDCYWQPRSALENLPKQPILIDRFHDEFVPLSPGQETPARESSTQSGAAEEIEDGLGFAWLMLSIAAKYLARDPESDMALMSYPRPALETAARLLGRSGIIQPEDWIVGRSPAEKLETLRGMAGKTAILSDEATSQNIAVSPRFGRCLDRYLVMVEGIISL